MKNILLCTFIIFFLTAGITGNVNAWQGSKANPADGKSKSGPTAGAGAFDDTTNQYFKKFRNLNSQLVAAYEDLNKYNNPDRSTKGMNLEDIMNQDGISLAKRQEIVLQDKKARTEEKITGLQKDAENLREDLIKYYGGTLPTNVSDAWKTEQDYTDYRISKYK